MHQMRYAAQIPERRVGRMVFGPRRRQLRFPRIVDLRLSGRSWPPWRRVEPAPNRRGDEQVCSELADDVTDLGAAPDRDDRLLYHVEPERAAMRTTDSTTVG